MNICIFEHGYTSLSVGSTSKSLSEEFVCILFWMTEQFILSELPTLINSSCHDQYLSKFLLKDVQISRKEIKVIKSYNYPILPENGFM